MQFCVLSSGSKANATVVIGDQQRLLIDCGLSCKEMEIRLNAVGISADSITGVLVTHEHYDHVRGLERFSKRYKLPIYCNRSTRRALSGYHFEVIDSGATFSVGEFTVRSIPISHDAVEPLAYSVTGAGETFSCITDLGVVTPAVRDALRRSHAVVLESNHDTELLAQCSYPWVLKQRIRSAHGHLNNAVTSALLEEEFHSELTCVVLGHISENSNTPDVARAAMPEHIRSRLGERFMTASVRAPLPILPVAALAQAA